MPFLYGLGEASGSSWKVVFWVWRDKGDEVVSIIKEGFFPFFFSSVIVTDPDGINALNGVCRVMGW